MLNIRTYEKEIKHAKEQLKSSINTLVKDDFTIIDNKEYTLKGLKDYYIFVVDNGTASIDRYIYNLKELTEYINGDLKDGYIKEGIKKDINNLIYAIRNIKTYLLNKAYILKGE